MQKVLKIVTLMHSAPWIIFRKSISEGNHSHSLNRGMTALSTVKNKTNKKTSSLSSAHTYDTHEQVGEMRDSVKKQNYSTCIITTQSPRPQTCNGSTRLHKWSCSPPCCPVWHTAGMPQTFCGAENTFPPAAETGGASAWQGWCFGFAASCSACQSRTPRAVRTPRRGSWQHHCVHLPSPAEEQWK